MSEVEERHARLSPSDAKRWLGCPASIEMVERMEADPEQAGLLLPDSSPYAQEGTLAHAVAAEVLEGGGVKGVDEAMLAHAERYTQYVEGLMKPDSQLFVERRVSYSNWVEDGDGTADAVVISEDGIDVVDYKYGQGHLVSAEDNPQMKLYALGVIQTFELLLPDADRVTMHIYQPRRDHYDSWDTTVSDLLAWADNVVTPRAQRIQSGEAWGRQLFWPSDSACEWCRAKAACPALAKHIADQAANHFDIDDAEGIEPAVKASPIDELVRASKIVPLLQKWANAVESKIADLVLSGEKVPGKKIVRGRSIRQWVDDKRADQALQRRGLKASDRYKPRQLISVKQAEDKLGREVMGKMARHVHKPEGALKVVNEANPSPAVELPVATDGFEINDEVTVKGA